MLPALAASCAPQLPAPRCSLRSPLPALLFACSDASTARTPWTVMPILESTMKQLFASGSRYKRLIISGHSLGGALSTLAAGHLQRVLNAPKSGLTPPQDILAYTFGEPRVGNETYARAHAKRVPNHCEWCHGTRAPTPCCSLLTSACSTLTSRREVRQ